MLNTLPENVRFIALQTHACARSLDELVPSLRESDDPALWYRHDSLETEHIRLLKELLVSLEALKVKLDSKVALLELEWLMRETKEALDFYEKHK